MKRWVHIVLGLGLIYAGAGAAEPLRAKWGEAVMVVQGLEADGRLRLVPPGAETGEALVPVSEARGLQFLLPPDYRRARRLAQTGRGGEALLLLRHVVPALVPYAAVEASNAGPAVQLYFRLLIQNREWADALAVWLALDRAWASEAYAAESAALAQGLEAEARWAELGVMLDGWWVVPPGPAGGANRQTVERLAEALRESGRWREAAILYQKLSVGTEGDERARYELLLAYLDWHQGSSLGAQAALIRVMEPAAQSEAGGLHRLLHGRVRLDAGDTRGALDVLADALVGAGGKSPWRLEIMAALAEAYLAQGDEEVAQRIAGDLRRQHPDSRWVAELEEHAL